MKSFFFSSFQEVIFCLILSVFEWKERGSENRRQDEWHESWGICSWFPFCSAPIWLHGAEPPWQRPAECGDWERKLGHSGWNRLVLLGLNEPACLCWMLLYRICSLGNLCLTIIGWSEGWRAPQCSRLYAQEDRKIKPPMTLS